MGARDYAMSDFSPTLVLQTSIAKSPNDMANVQIKSEILTPFGGIFPIMDQFNTLLAKTGENGTYPPTRNSSIDSLEASVGLHIASELIVATSAYFHPFL